MQRLNICKLFRFFMEKVGKERAAFYEEGGVKPLHDPRFMADSAKHQQDIFYYPREKSSFLLNIFSCPIRKFLLQTL